MRVEQFFADEIVRTEIGESWGSGGTDNAHGRTEREGWIHEYTPLVKRIAHSMMAKLPASVDVNDIVQAGMLGLLDAITRYEDTQGAQFETYAAQRIRGAIFDELRRSDWLPRGVRRELRRIDSATRTLEHRQGRAPSEKEVADFMNLSLADCRRMLQHAHGGQVLHLEDLAHPDGEHYLERHEGGAGRGILEAMLEGELHARLSKAVSELPEREQLVVSLYYQKDLNLKEIGEVLGVTESRVCQIHARALTRLQAKIHQP